MNISKIFNPISAIGILFLILFASSCKDSLVGVEGFCPLVESTTPVNLETEVDKNTVVTVTFEEKIDPATMIPAAFELTSASSDTASSKAKVINGDISYDDDSNTMSFTPNAPLESGTVYTGRVKNTIKDPLGNKMLEDYVWTFTTEAPTTFTLNVTAENGAVAIDPDQQSYEEGAEVVLTATPAEGYVFTSWSGDATGSDNPLTVTMDSNKDITANFMATDADTFTLNVTANNGSVEKDPDQQSYEAGSQVVLTATPAEGYVFTSWSGDATGSDNPLTVTMNSNKNITANFTAKDADTFTLNVTADNGSVEKDPDQQSYEEGAEVVLTATPNDGYEFSSWSGDATGSDNPLTVTMDSNKNITANFTAKDADTFTLNVTADNGSVEKDPDQQSYEEGAEVVLTATPNDGYEFSSWSGDATGSDNPLTVTMDSNKNITANFTAIAAETFTLNVTAENGTVEKDPDQQSYNNGDEVILTATANDGYEFSSWSGDATGSDNPLTVIMDSNKDITANFTAIAAETFTLNVTADNGSVEIDPDQQSYEEGAEVVLTATPDDGYEFTSWSDDATGSDNPLTVIMDENKNITANFTAVEDVMTVDLGDASRFGAFGGSAGITNQGINTVINGSIGTTAASTKITGFHDELTGDVYTETTLNIGAVTDGIFTAPPAPGTETSLKIAQDGLEDAREARNSISPASLPGGIDLGTDELGGLTLAPGVYKSASGSYAISDVDLTLDAQGDENATWIFQVESSLTVGTPSGPRSIIMKNGAKPKNVFWFVGSAATINGAGGGTMVGTILSDAGVTFSTAGNVDQTVLNGRAISLTASVTMVNTTINVPE